MRFDFFSFRMVKKHFTTLSEAFHLIVKKYGLEGCVELHELRDRDWTFTLFRIIKNEAERDLPLPDKLVREVHELVITYHPKKKRYDPVPTFAVGRGKTIEEVEEDMAAWNRHCAMAHLLD